MGGRKYLDRGIPIAYFIPGASAAQATGIPRMSGFTWHFVRCGVITVLNDDDIVDDIAMYGYPSKMAIVGHSRGGYHALKFAHDHPDIRVGRLCVIDAWPPLYNTLPPLVEKCYNHFVYDSGADPNEDTLSIQGASNYNYTGDRHTCRVGVNHSYSHTVIDDCELVFQRVVQTLIAYFGWRGK